METLETERLVLRPFCQNDLVSLFDYARDPAVGPAAGWKPHSSIDESRAVLAEFLRIDEVWALTLRGEDRPIGSLGLHPDRRRDRPFSRMMGYVLGSAHWGQGYMTEAAQAALAYAFNEMDLELVSVYHYPTNMRSRRVIEKCGFTYEGKLRAAGRLPDGTLTDELCYSITQKEYWEL